MSKIAIIDDDPDIVEAITILLESNGYTVISAGNIEEGFQLVQSNSPDLILLDVMMEEPDDGFYLANKFKKLGVKTPIVMLTSVAKAFGYEYGVSDKLAVEEFIEKPVAPNILMEKISKLLEQSEG